MRTLSFTLNGSPKSITVDESRPLLWVLRDDLGLTGTKFGCGEAECGSCTVVVDRKALRACVTPMSAVEGKSVTTIEGLATGEKLHPVQEEFVKHVALQCGFCTPGLVMSAYALLLENKSPSRADILRKLEGHLCRCGAHVRVVAAVEAAAAALKAGAP